VQATDISENTSTLIYTIYIVHVLLRVIHCTCIIITRVRLRLNGENSFILLMPAESIKAAMPIDFDIIVAIPHNDRYKCIIVTFFNMVIIHNNYTR